MGIDHAAVGAPRRRLAARQAARAGGPHARRCGASPRGRASTSPPRTAPTTSRSPPRALRIPAVNTFDYEFAVQQHNIGCRLARRVMTPGRDPARAARALRRRAATSSSSTRGSRRSTTSSDFDARPGRVRASSGSTARRSSSIVRPPPDVSLYHRKSNPLFPRVLERLGRDEDVTAVVIPRTARAARARAWRCGLPSVIVPGARGRRPEPDRARRPRRSRRAGR